MKKVGIVDYRMGNLDSVARAVEECGGHPVITNGAKDLRRVSYIILPGVGSFSSGMENVRKLRLDEILAQEVIERRIPFLGICLGMQLLAQKGWEGSEMSGLGWIDGEVRKLQDCDRSERVPHVGWNDVIPIQTSHLFRHIPPGKDFYFVHSYHLICARYRDVIAYTPYCGGFTSALNKENIYGVQFHPEKSQKNGFQIIRNFLSL